MRILLIIITALTALPLTAVTTDDSVYVCRDGIYQCRLLQSGLTLNLPDDTTTDSITFSRPQTCIEVDFATFAQNHKVNAVFIKATGGQRLTINNTMKPYTVASANASDVARLDIEPGQTSVSLPIDIITNLTKGIDITLLYDEGQYLTMSDPTPIRRIQNTFVCHYTIDAAKARPSCWMATLPSRLRANMLTLPGTHDSATSAVSTSMAQTQTLSIGQQLKAGIRAFDLRPRYNASAENDIALANLEIYHGIIATGVKWHDAMDTIVTFLKQNPTETVFINLQKENASGSTDYSQMWRTSIRTYLQQNRQYVLQQLQATTSLADCRGKMVVVSHNPYGAGTDYYGTVFGALTASWDDNATFTTNLNYTNSTPICQATITDSYNTTNTTDKQALILTNLTAASNDNTTRWYYTFVNVAWRLFGSNPSHYAEIHNAYLHDLLASQKLKGRLGIIFCDYLGSTGYTPQLTTDIIQQNYKYIYPEK